MKDFYDILNSGYWVLGFMMGIIVAFLPFVFGKISTFILQIISKF